MLTTTLSLLLLFAQQADVVIVSLPARGTVNLDLAPAGKLEIERLPTVFRVRVEIEHPPSPESIKPMNTFVVWAASPEGIFENLGELGIVNGKGRLEATTRLDQFALLITAEPHHMVDRPSDLVVYRNLAPRVDNIRRATVSLPVGENDYTGLQSSPSPTETGLPAQARAAFQIASSAGAERWAPTELRLARIALDTMEDMVKRTTPMDIVAPVANEAIRKSQLASVAARNRAAASALEAAKDDASSQKRDVAQLQDRLEKISAEQAAATERIRRLESDLDRATRDREQLSLANDASSSRVRRLETELADAKRMQEELQNAAVLKLSDEFFDYGAGIVAPGGVTVLSKIVAAASLWKTPIQVMSPGKGVDIAKRYFSDAGVPDGRIIVAAER
jgi:hypothetical protein